MKTGQEHAMNLKLPQPIDLYVRQENFGDGEDLAAGFAAGAVVKDEGRTYVGRRAIARWRADAKRKYRHSVAPLELARAGGKIVLKAMLFGKFPGSPVVLEFAFVLRNRQIVSLEIGS
jgi:hypothetical protein